MADIVQAALGLERAKAGARMAKSDISGFTDPIQKQVGEITERNKEARKNFVSNIPDNYEFDLIPAEAKAKLTTFLKDKKQEYIDFADQASRYSGNTSSKEYTDAVEGMENVKAAMNRNYEDLVVAKQIRQYELDNESKGIVGFVGDDNADSRRTAIIDGSTFNNVEFTDDGAFINDGFGDKISWRDYKKTPTRNVAATDAIDKIGVNVRKLGRAGEDKAYLQRYVKGELGKLFANEGFADEVYNMGFYGDTEGDTVYKNIPGATKDNMVDFFTDMVINDNYAPPLAKSNGISKESIIDEETFINAINAGVPAVLSDITGDKEDKYIVIVPDENNKGKYKLVSRTKGADLEGFKPMSLVELSKFTKIPLPALTGVQENKKDILNPFN